MDNLDRRNFLKRTAAAGALGVSAPLLVQSVALAAAACSGQNLLGLVVKAPATTGFVASIDTGVTPPIGSTYVLSSTFPLRRWYRTPINSPFGFAPGDLAVVAFTVITATTNDVLPSVRLVDNGPGAPTPSGTFTLATTSVTTYRSSDPVARLYVATLPIAAPHINRTVEIGLTDPAGTNLVGEVIAITGGAGAVNAVTATPTANRVVTAGLSGNPDTAVLQYTAVAVDDGGSPQVDSGTWAGVDQSAASLGAFPGSFSEVGNNSNRETGLSRFFTNTPPTSIVTTFTPIGNATATDAAFNSGACVLEIGC